MAKMVVFLYLQATCTVLALIFNSFLIYVVKNYTKSTLGAYKYVLITFAAFEMTYAIVVLIGMPINYIAENSWIVFSHDGIIGRTPLNIFGPTLYCTFYELWMGLVVVHFIYRYIVVCKPEWKQKIEDSWKVKIFVACIYLTHFGYAVLCGIFFCTRTMIFKELQEKIREDFDVQEPESIGYILLRIRARDGSLNPGGIISIFNHYLLVLLSVVIITYTGINIWLAIRRMQTESVHLKEVNLQREVFRTLLIQTVIPFFLCHFPTLVWLVGTSPFIDQHFSFGSLSSIFSFLTAVPKVLDPIVVLSCIKEYRKAVLKILCFRRLKRVAILLGHDPHPLTGTHNMTTNIGSTTNIGLSTENTRNDYTAADVFRREQIQIHGIPQ